MNILIQVGSALIATIFFSMLFNQPFRSSLFSGLIAAIGYGVFITVGKTTVAYFLSALLIGISCEMMARFFKMTASLFITSSIIPLVPGVGLYRTMFSISQGHYIEAVEVGTKSVEGICAIALAITFSTMLFTSFRHHPQKKSPIG